MIYKLKRYLFAAVAMLVAAAPLSAQDNGGVTRRRASDRRGQQQQQDGTQVTQRMQQFYDTDGASISDADRAWMRVIYRQLDLEKDKNAPLYFPEEPVDGQLNLFRVIMQLLADNKVSAYEYLDGREIFTDQYKINVRDMLDRFHIYYQPAKGSTDKNPRFTIEEADVPANEVLSYYLIERWEYDTRTNRVRPYVEAICPVLHRSGDFGGEALKYPMFWIKFSDVRPWLSQQMIFLSDDNNLPTCSIDDFFNLTMYDGEIYKTRNLKNKSMAQLYPDADDRKRAADSIQSQIDNFGQKLWVPDREQVIAQREAREAAARGEATEGAEGEAAVAEATKEKKEALRSTKRSSKRSAAKVKKPKEPKPQNNSSNAVRSVRRRK